MTAQAGIQTHLNSMGSRLRGNDESGIRPSLMAIARTMFKPQINETHMTGTPAATVERVYGMFLTMLLIRAFDEAAGQARRDGKLRGSVHEYIGEEAIATGVCANLLKTDYISSYHRRPCHALAKGA